MDLSDVCSCEDLYTVFVNPSSEVAKFDAVCEFTFICSDSSWKPFSKDQSLPSSEEVALDQAEFASLDFLIIYVHSECFEYSLLKGCHAEAIYVSRLLSYESTLIPVRDQYFLHDLELPLLSEEFKLLFQLALFY